jgi:DNA repair ATPase RecN
MADASTEVTTFFKPDEFNAKNNDFLTSIKNQTTEIKDMEDFLNKLNESIAGIKESLNIKTDSEYEGIGGFFNKIGKNFDDVKKQLQKVQEWTKKHGKKVAIGAVAVTGLGALAYFLLPLL